MLSKAHPCIVFEVCRPLNARQLVRVAFASSVLCAVSREAAEAKVRDCIATRPQVDRWRRMNNRSIFHELDLIERAAAYIPSIAGCYKLHGWRTLLRISPSGDVTYTGGWKRRKGRLTVVGMAPSPHPDLDGTYILERVYEAGWTQRTRKAEF